MFVLNRPDQARIDAFLRDAEHLDLSYRPIGLARSSPQIHHASTVIGSGADDFERARAALMRWQQFDLGWVTLFPRHAPTEVGTNVAVQIQHLGFWSLNGCRVVYRTENTNTRFGYAYGTLTSHSESGEEIFEVSFDHASGEVIYRLRAVATPQHWLARLGTPYVRMLQARFRRDSLTAMRRAVRAGPSPP